jgi:DNA-directed RNA polymerase specialized sigma24 family protein
VADPRIQGAEPGPPEETEEVLDEQSLRPAERAVVGERYALLLDLLQPMDEDRRIVFILKEIDGFTTSEVAGMLAIPLDTAHSRLHAAWDELEGRLRERKGWVDPGGVAAWLGDAEEAGRRRMSFS